MTLFFVTQNKNKVKEFGEILGFNIKQADVEAEEIQAVEVEKVAEYKAREAFKKLGKPVIVEDTGLYFKEWNGLPGALAKFFGEKLGWQGLADLLGEEREALAKTVIGFFDGKEYKSFSGSIEGSISEKALGENGFGWDVIFIPHGFDKTFAEIENKNSISMRRKALEKFKDFLGNE